MVVLRSMDKFDDFAELDTSTGQVSWFSQHTDPVKASRPVHGAVAQMAGRVLCLYREAGVLHFKVDDEDFELTEGIQVELIRVREDLNRITVLRDGALLFTWTYQRPTIDPPLEYDPTPFIEQEHFDFCLLVYNVANDPGRKERIYTEHTKSGKASKTPPCALG